MKTLMHACCAPCSIRCVESLRAEAIEPVLFWHNPNIHPFTEYQSRKEALIQFAKEKNLQLILKDTYGLRYFIEQVYPDFDKRCGYCYHMRMEEAAKYALEHGFDSFTTTLLISPYQNHDLIIQTAQALAEEYHISFLYRDFRPLFREGQKAAKEMGLYMQKYCGCIFSEEERYQKQKGC